jgi:hypothetical protein
MGQGQSSSKPGTTVEATIKTSYYTLIGVERDATDEEYYLSCKKSILSLKTDR